MEFQWDHARLDDREISSSNFNPSIGSSFWTFPNQMPADPMGDTPRIPRGENDD